MMENQQLSLWFIFKLLIINKKKLILIFLCSLVFSYGGVFFLTEKQYESTATIIPLNDSSLSGLSALFNNVSSMLPVGLGNISNESDMNMFNTIIYSRSSIEDCIKKFDLQKLYKIKQREDAVKVVRKIIKTSITLNNAYEIKVRTKSPQLAAEMTNYLVKYLNDKIIQLNGSKSKENRLFLEKRYNEITTNLRTAEDSLRQFQEKTGVFVADNQIQASLETYAKLDAELATKQIEIQVLKKMYGENSSNVQSAQIAHDVLRNKVKKIKNGSDSGSVIMSLSTMPKTSLDFYRHYRNVRIYNEMLSYILPMFEQAKFEEQKNIPILQIIDNAIPPERKAYPSRTFMAIVVTTILMLFVCSYLVISEFIKNTDNEKILFLKKELFNFK